MAIQTFSRFKPDRNQTLPVTIKQAYETKDSGIHILINQHAGFHQPSLYNLFGKSLNPAVAATADDRHKKIVYLLSGYYICVVATFTYIKEVK